MGTASATDTIVAVATAAGPAVRACLRLSGSRARAIVDGCFAPGVPAARGFRPGALQDGIGEQPALLLWMPGPRSYTGEDVAELHVVGAAPLVSAALARLVALGARPAEAGEFTRRAFEHGRIDLARAEGVAALVAARGEDEHRAAARLLAGGLGERASRATEALLELRALAEASLDFDETDTGAVPRAELAALLASARAEVDAARADVAAQGPPPGVARVALAGAPNAGKSALYNALTGERALVAPHAGTTRDVLVAPWRPLGGEVELVDLPGIDPGAAGIDARAQQRAREVLAGADVVLWVASARGEPAPPDARERAAWAAGAACVLVWSQVDAAGAPARPPAALQTALGGAPWVATSAVTGEGLDALAREVARAVGLGAAMGDGHPSPASLSRELGARHAAALDAASGEMDEGARVLAASGPLDLAAAHFAAAADHLGDLSGRTTPEDVLDRIFARFCLGK